MKHYLIERNPEMYFENIHHELNNFLRDTLLPIAISNQMSSKKDAFFRPAVEIKQSDENYKVKVQLPGVKKDNIKVDLDNDMMTISAEMQEEKEEKSQKEHNERYHTSEFRYGKYQRTISFDTPIQAQESSAEFKNGVLTITVPKKEVEEHHVKSLEIKE